MATVRRLQAVIDTDGVSSFTSEMGAAKGSLIDFRSAVGGTGLALAGLAAGGLALAVNEAQKFQQSMVELEKVTNAETVDAMSSSIKEMAETIPLAQTELADIAADAGRFGVRGPKNIRNFTEAVAKMATATNLNAQKAGESLAKLAQLTGTPIPKVENLGSAINALSNNFATSSKEIVDNMLRSSAAMTQFGLSETEIAGFAATLNEVSESSERAGTRLRRLVQELSNPKKIDKFATALGWGVDKFKAMRKNDPTGLLIKLAKGMRKGGKAAKAINKNLSTTSRQALAGLGQNLDGLNQSLKMSRKEFQKNSSLQKEFQKSSKTLSNQVQLLKNRLRNVAISIGNRLLPVVTKVVKAFSRAVSWFSKLNKETNGMAGPVVLLTSLFGGLALAAWAFAPAIGAAVTALAGLAVPIAAVIAGIALVSAAIIKLHDMWTSNFMGIRTTTIKIFNKVKQVIQAAMKFIRDNIINPIVNRIRKVWSQHGAKLRREARETWNAVTKDFKKLRNTIWPVIQGFVKDAKRLWNQWGDEIMAVAKFVFEGLLGQVEVALDAILTSFSFFMNLIQGDWEGAWNDISGFLERTMNKITGFVEHWGQRLIDWLGKTVNDFINWIQELDRKATKRFKQMLDDIISDVQNWGQDLAAEVRGAVKDALSMLTNLAGDFRQAGENLLGTFIDGINSKIDDLKGTVNGAVGWVNDRLPGSDAKKGPLSNLTASGEALPETFAKGIQRNKDPVVDAADALGKAGMPSPKARTAARQRRSDGGKTTIFNVDVNVPRGVDVDTAARTFTDEVRSRNWN